MWMLFIAVDTVFSVFSLGKKNLFSLCNMDLILQDPK